MAARQTKEEMMAEAIETLGAQPDPSGQADLVFDRGQMVVAGDSGSLKSGFSRLKKIDGYRWLLINSQDLMMANTLSIGSKAGMITPQGKILKAADLPRKKL